VAQSIEAFAVSVFGGDVRPKFAWNIDNPNGTITAKQIGGPQADSKATLWTATTLGASRRDFRLIALGSNGKPAVQPILWTSTTIEQAADGSWTAPCPQPANGWRACYLALQAPARSGFTHVFTTDVSIVPQTFPCEECQTPEQCHGVLV
jgi:PhoPQ-activated pathogenicity-related protein